ncbi:major facilitator superfamily domain-containing protein [Mrakia frigida]|uniref:major facilitator superfamily domain-containing protein n=1 Tax=Mrakia frigida TaxID=29902 RepID=UPI003FCC12ED
MSIVPSPSARTRTSSNATLTDAAETRREDEKVNEQNEKDSSDSPRPSDLEEGLEVSEEVDPYTRFSPRRKTFITSTVSFAALMAPLASSAFFPSIPNIATDVGSTQEVINYTVAIYLLALGAAPLIWAPLSGFYGRKPIYLVSLPIFVAASIGVSFSTNLGALIAARIFQAIGSSAVLSVGAGTIGDIYCPTERATAMGQFYLGAVMGPAFAPVIAGVFQEYTTPGWKTMQWFLAGMGALGCFLVAFFLPETWHGPTPHDLAKQATGKRFVIYWFHPFRAVALLKMPNILLISLNSSFTLLTTYVLLVPLTYTMAPRYGISNVAIVGCLYLPQGFGNIAGSRVGGVYADRTVAKWIKKRGYRRPEDRLYSTLFGGAVVLPVAILGAGWSMDTGAGGVAVPCVFLFLSGVGLMFVLASANTYCVDCMQKRSSEVIAINNFVRYAFAAGASAGILPLVKAIGVGPANTIAAGLGLIGVVLVLAIIRWGEGWAGRGPPETPPTTPPPAAIGEEPSKLEEKAMEDANGFEPIDEAAREAIEVDFRERGDHALSRGKSSRRTSEPPLPLLKTFSIEHPHPV